MSGSSTVAVLGLGVMGARVADRLVDAGFALAVWNRTSGGDAERRLVDGGARRADTPADAARGADVVLVCVRDDEASEAVWADVAPALGERAVGVELSTVTPGRVAAEARRLGDRFLAAPMLGSRPQVEAGQLVLLAAGPESTFARARGVLDAIAGTVRRVGDDPAAAATLKLAVNALLAVQLAATGEALALAREAGIDERAAGELLAALPTASPVVQRSMPRILDDDRAPLFTLELAEKDLRYAGARHGAGALVQAAARVARAAVDAGHGEDDVIALARAPQEARTGIEPV